MSVTGAKRVAEPRQSVGKGCQKSICPWALWFSKVICVFNDASEAMHPLYHSGVEVDSSCRLLKVPLFRGSGGFESFISLHHSRFICECYKEEIDGDDDDGLANSSGRYDSSDIRAHALKYRVTSLIRNSAPLGPYSRTIPRALWWS